VTISGTFHIREEADISKLATELGEVIAGRAGINRRMGFTY
jgi:hypothetical protein